MSLGHGSVFNDENEMLLKRLTSIKNDREIATVDDSGEPSSMGNRFQPASVDFYARLAFRQKKQQLSAQHCCATLHMHAQRLG